jgi:hypothetical protein
MPMDLGRQRVDLTREVGVRAQFLSLGREVVVGLGALELCLAVLADHHERRQKDRLERHDEREPRPRIGFDKEHPAGEGDDVEVDEPHGRREGGDRIDDAKLQARRSPGRIFEDDWVMEVSGPGDHRATWVSGLPPTSW